VTVELNHRFSIACSAVHTAQRLANARTISYFQRLTETHATVNVDDEARFEAGGRR